MNRRFFFLVAALVPGIYATDYVGSSACAMCHQTEFANQSASHHAHALRPIGDSLAGTVLLRDGHSPDGRLRYEQAGNEILVHENGVPEILRLQWAFGAAAQGSTPVGLLDGRFVEHQFSYYSRLGDLAPTFGHPKQVTAPLAELGVALNNKTITTCFNCHATALAMTDTGPNVESLVPGVQCERCHGPGSAHVQAASEGASVNLLRTRIVNPGRMSAKAQIQICGQCHRLPTPDAGDEPELENPISVRFAPMGLLASQCFLKSNAISCLTCHNPHEDARPRSDLAYSAKCLVCHASNTHPTKACLRRVQNTNCLNCHMKQSSLGAYLRFTDHRIRVY